MDNDSANPSSGEPPFDSLDSAMKPESIHARKEVFRKLVLLQDEGETVETSRIRISIQFDIPLEDVKTIEREGIAGNWPPLG